MKSIYKLLASFALICALMPALVSCSDDDDEVLAVTNIIGSYSGSLDANVMGTDCDMPGQYQVTIQKEPKEKDEVQVVLPECSFEIAQMGRKQTIPSLTIPEVNVKQTSNGYEISESNCTVTLDGVTYTVSVDGKISGKKADIFYTVSPGKMGMNINFTFNGTYK